VTRSENLAADRLAVLVHEVRSPVAALSTIAGAARADDPGLPRLVELATAACRSIGRLLPDAAAGSVELEDVDAGALVREVVATAELRDARVRAIVQDGLPQLRADPVRLRQALDNLVANALVHAPRGDEVVVAAALADDGRLLLSVSDRGDGIPPREQARIFERGVRLDDTRPGSGLGLAIAKAIAEAHGGTLTVESEPGSGSTFAIALPVV
jgi:two-component system sensor histidine kinase BaeS